jgi:hypothetical protein
MKMHFSEANDLDNSPNNIKRNVPSNYGLKGSELAVSKFAVRMIAMLSSLQSLVNYLKKQHLRFLALREIIVRHKN